MDGLVRAFVEDQGALRGLLMHRLGNEEDVLDILQELFVKVSELDGQDEITDPHRYLRRTAVNMAVDRLRRRARRKQILGQPDVQVFVHEDASNALTPEQVTEDRQRLKQMQQILDTLPANCREAFLLSRCDGLTYEEIAKRLGVSRNMVKKHLVRALAKLRTEMPLFR